MSPVSAGEALAAGYLLLRAGGPAASRGRAGLAWVEGPDAVGFLQGLLTNDVAGLGPGGSTSALILDAKGHIQAAVGVHRDAADAFTLVLDPAAADEVVALLNRYHFSEDIEILGPEESDVVTVIGVDPGGAAMAVPGPLPGSRDVAADDAATLIAELGLPEVPAVAVEWARVAAGLPRVGSDTGPATLVQEAGLEGRTVSFTKGCYMGQETVARVAFRGRVNRTLRGLLLPGAVEPGAAVTHDDREVGRVGSVAPTPDLGTIALAILRHEVPEGAAVAVEGLDGAAHVVTLPFPAP